MSRELSTLRPVLERWLEAIERYIREIRKAYPGEEADASFWYGERASLSSVAGAAWTFRRGVALEEYAAPKRKKGTTGRHIGRSDLFLLINGKGFAIEAKHEWMSLGRKGRAVKALPEWVREWLHEAIEDVKGLRDVQGRRLAMVFIVPHLPKAETGELRERVRDFLVEVEQLGYSMAWWFSLSRCPTDYRGAIYPGVVLIVRSL